MPTFRSLVLFIFWALVQVVHAQDTLVWKGIALNDSLNWFNPSNWYPAQVPDSLSDVLINGTAYQDCEIRGRTAYCRSLTMLAKRLKLKNSEDTLFVKRNLTLISGYLDAEGVNAGGTIRLKGDWLHKSGDAQSFAIGNGWMLMEGDQPQQIYSDINERFYRLVIRKCAQHVTLATNVFIEAGLQLEQGVIHTSNDNLLIMNENATLLSAGTQQTGGSTLSYINGPMKRKTQNNGVIYIFPIGTEKIYAPIALRPNSSELQTYTASYSDKGWGDYTVSSFQSQWIPRICTNEYWNLSYEDTTKNGSALLTLYWRSHTGLPITANRSNLHIVKWNKDLGWERQDELPAIADISSLWGKVVSDWNVSAQGVFTLGSSTDMFPPYFSDIIASITEDYRVRLDWKMQTVPHPDYFQIERSVDGVSFSPIGRLDSIKQGAYIFAFIDRYPASGKNYYKIKQVDVNGAYNYSEVVMINVSFNGTSHFSGLYPNPVQDVTNLNLDYYIPQRGLITIEIYDNSARRVYKDRIWADAGNSSLPIDVSTLPTGLYYCVFKFRGEMETVKFIKE